MPLPNFTDDEQYLINGAKSTAVNAQTNSYMWGYLVSCAALAGFGASCHQPLMILTAFGLVCGFRIYEDRFQSKWSPMWSSIIAKYETACTGGPEDNRSDDDAE